MMKIKGRIICRKGNYAIARLNGAKMGKVYSTSGRYIGRIIRIFGPVKKPYAKLKIERKWRRGIVEIYVRGDRR